ncbi:hypothetical protein SSOG_01983 [Streptomyces himastatinicus ATCC 53653]|uniref:Uncharacterized protein n=1 Tax=Streptomyces himastatinicus ATCC 53653 TaxID=457427 RepID=D9WU23_9ACTN|nr:hypothetical protein [Streptomyces himastatinicus]EFL22271.1 hypothetical protein SSOG_01983 [Streptomyces himastatinicus ATCC 53653]
MFDHEILPPAVDTEALLALSREHHARTARAWGTREVGGHLVKVYSVHAPGRAVTDQNVATALRLAGGHLELGATRGSLGLAVLIVHAGGDGDYVLIHSWIEGYMSDLAVFSGPADAPDELRPGRVGLAPCVWEAAVLAHEREAFSRHLLDGDGALADRLAAWQADTLDGGVR